MNAGEAGSLTEGAQVPVRVFISYAHDDDDHVDRVRNFWLFLRANGIDARLDLPAAEKRVAWAQWMTREVRDADRVLVIASPAYKKRAEGDAKPDEGRGVQFETRLVQEVFYTDQEAGLQRVIPVVLPGGSADDLPLWLAPVSTSCYRVHEYTMAGADKLLRLLTDQPFETEPPLGKVPVLPPRGAGQPTVATSPVLRTEVVIEAALSEQGELASAVWVAGSLLSQRKAPLPAEVGSVWEARRSPAVGGQRLAEAGRRLAGTLLDADGQGVLAKVVGRIRPGDTVAVALVAGGDALSLPVELIRLATDSGDIGPLGLMPGISVMRRLATPGRQVGDSPPSAADRPPGTAGPLKVLAAVAAPDEAKTRSAPLDAEAEMQAVLDAVTGLGDQHAQVRILEVASLPEIRRALEQDTFHVLHLSAHGSPKVVELEDEDGAPATVTSHDLMQAVQHAGRPVPLIVLSSCSGGSTGSSRCSPPSPTPTPPTWPATCTTNYPRTPP